MDENRPYRDRSAGLVDWLLVATALASALLLAFITIAGLMGRLP